MEINSCLSLIRSEEEPESPFENAIQELLINAEDPDVLHDQLKILATRVVGSVLSRLTPRALNIALVGDFNLWKTFTG